MGFYMRLIVLLSLFVSFFSYSEFELKQKIDEVSIYENKDKNARIIIREHIDPIPVPISRKNLEGIAQTRFKALEVLDIGHHDFKVQRVYRNPIEINKDIKTYVWKGSYKNRKSETQYMTEFLTATHTYNVFTVEEHKLKESQEMLRGVL